MSVEVRLAEVLALLYLVLSGRKIATASRAEKDLC